MHHRLLEDSSEALAQITALSEDSAAVVAEQTLGEIDNSSTHLPEHYKALSDRAKKFSGLERCALALGLKPDIEVSAIGRVAKAATARFEAAAAIEANMKARELLGARWRGPESDPNVVKNVLRAAVDVERASLPEPMRRYLFHAERNVRIAGLRALQKQLHEELEVVLEGWSKVENRGKVDEAEFYGYSVGEASIAMIAGRVQRALDMPDQLGVWPAGSAPVKTA